MPPNACAVRSASASVDSGEPTSTSTNDRIGAGLADLLRDALAVLLLDLRDHHARALRGEPLRVGLADPAARARDDRDLAVDSVEFHGVARYAIYIVDAM